MGQELHYQNPNLGVPVRDACILPVDGRFYATGTCWPYWESTPEPNPGVRLYVSDNLTDWSEVGLMIDAAALPEDAWYKERFWAPELHRIRGRFYLTFNCRNESEAHRHHHACGVAVADHVEGPYRVMNHDEPLTPWPSNDLSLFEDGDGRVYAVFNNGWTDVHRIYVAELDLERMRLKEDPVPCISQEEGTWDQGGIEAAYIIKNNGTYFLFYSSWTDGYAVGYATADDIRGPWRKSADNPLFGARRERGGVRYGQPLDDPAFALWETGHNAVFRGPDDQLWISCHAYLKGAACPGLVMDPIWFEGDRIRTTAPSCTPQRVALTEEQAARYPGLREPADVAGAWSPSQA